MLKKQMSEWLTLNMRPVPDVSLVREHQEKDDEAKELSEEHARRLQERVIEQLSLLVFDAVSPLGTDGVEWSGDHHHHGDDDSKSHHFR